MRVVGLKRDDVRLGDDVGRFLFPDKAVSSCVEGKLGVKVGDMDVGLGEKLTDGRLVGDDNGRLVRTVGCKVGCKVG